MAGVEKLRGRKVGGEMRGRDDASREEIGEREREIKGRKKQKGT